MVSAVEPDLAMGTTMVLAGFIDSSADWMKTGSTLSRITSRGLSARKGRLHRVRAAQAAVQRPRAQGAAADAGDADRVISARDRFGVSLDFFDQYGLEGEMREADLSGLHAVVESGQRGQRGWMLGSGLLRRQPVLHADHRSGEISGIKMDSHGGLGGAAGGAGSLLGTG